MADKNKFNKTESRQNNNNSTNYDPDYNRNLNRPAPQPIYQQPPLIPMIPQQANFNNNYFNPGNNPNFMKYAPPPGYQNFPPNNNLLNDLHYQNQNPTQPNLNALFGQMNYNNYGMYQNNGPQIGLNPMNIGPNISQNSMNMNMGPNPMINPMNMGQNSMNNPMNMGIFQQQPMQQPIYNNDFQGNVNKTNNENFVGSMFMQENSRNYNMAEGINNNNQVVGSAEVKKKQNKFNLEKIFNEENFPTLEQAKVNKH